MLKILFLLLGCSFQLHSQDSIPRIVTDSIQIIDFMNRSENIVISEGSKMQNSFLGTIENQSFAAIRSGGPAVLSTVLHRGMASRHLAVLWGGFNIQSVVNGTFDLGLIRNTFDEVKFYNKGTTSSTGNASIAGALSLGNQIHRNNTTIVSLSASTANNLSTSLIHKFRHKKYYHHLAINNTSDKNEYSYANGGVKLTQKLAKFSMRSLNYEGHFIASDHFSLTGGLWLHDADRNIPPTKTSVHILQEQRDTNYRGFLHGNYYPSSKIRLVVRSAYFDELLDYQAPGIASAAKSKILNGSVDMIHSSGIKISSQYRNDRVDASFFNVEQRRNTIALLAAYNTTIFNNVEFGFSIRPEWVDRERQPLGIGVSLSKDISTKLSSAFRYNKGYTLPSFNDLYWPIGGNSDLKTEESHEFDLGLKLKYGVRQQSALSFNLYLNLIDNWIQWTPVEGFFQPVNQRKVRNIGFETKIEKTFHLGEESKLNIMLMYSFTDSRLVKHYLNPANEGKRTIYVPVHKLNGQISWLFKSWQFQLKTLYYSKRYNTVDNSTFVPGFFIADIEAVKLIKIKNHELNISLAIENGFNNDYENIKFYPMPLRIFRLGINIKL